MVRDIMKDEAFLSQKAEPATPEELLKGFDVGSFAANLKSKDEIIWS